MACLLSIDFGLKRTGLAHTDADQIIASGLKTLPTESVIDYLKYYCKEHDVETFVVGQPLQKDGKPSVIERQILKFIDNLKLHFPNIPIERYDERFTSKIALRTLIDTGVKQKKRRDKAVIDQISATLILQSYLNYKSNLDYKFKKP